MFYTGEPDPSAEPRLGLVLGGGGARAAYQVGFLRFLARELPDLHVPILTGTSAGAINAVHLAAHPGPFVDAVDSLSELWRRLTVDQVFRSEGAVLMKTMIRWGLRFVSGGRQIGTPPQGMVDTSPLRTYLRDAIGGGSNTPDAIPGIEENLRSGRLAAVAVTSTNYGTGQSITWTQGNEPPTWERPHRRGVRATLTLDHVLASSALPFFFPAIPIGDAWHGDGGIRQTAPLSPALHLGAQRILAVSTRYLPRRSEEGESQIQGYPPIAQVAGVMLSAIFLDALEFDATNLERLNHLLEQVPPEERGPLRPVDLFTTRPSQNLSRIAADYEGRLPQPFRFLQRGLGTRETRSPDSLSMLMFQPEYLECLIDLGERDAERRADEILAFLADSPRHSEVTKP